MKAKTKSSNVVWHHATVTHERRMAQNKHRSVVLGFAGISSPYGTSVEPELKVATGDENVDACVEEVLELLHGRGVIAADVGLAPSNSDEPRSRAA